MFAKLQTKRVISNHYQMNEDMHTREIQNWMLYDLLREVKDDIARLEARLEAKIDKNTDRIDKNTERIEGLYLNQNKVKISFSRTFAIANMLFSGIIAYFTVLFTGKYQT